MVSQEYLEHPLIGGSTEGSNKTLIIVVSSDRGLCGGLNTNIIKKTRNLIRKLENEEKSVSILCIGKKGYDALSVFNKEYFNYSTKLINISDVDYLHLQNAN